MRSGRGEAYTAITLVITGAVDWAALFGGVEICVGSVEGEGTVDSWCGRGEREEVDDKENESCCFELHCVAGGSCLMDVADFCLIEISEAIRRLSI